jgi:hypothetical protein
MPERDGIGMKPYRFSLLCEHDLSRNCVAVANRAKSRPPPRDSNAGQVFQDDGREGARQAPADTRAETPRPSPLPSPGGSG